MKENKPIKVHILPENNMAFLLDYLASEYERKLKIPKHEFIYDKEWVSLAFYYLYYKFSEKLFELSYKRVGTLPEAQVQTLLEESRQLVILPLEFYYIPDKGVYMSNVEAITGNYMDFGENIEAGYQAMERRVLQAYKDTLTTQNNTDVDIPTYLRGVKAYLTLMKNILQTITFFSKNELKVILKHNLPIALSRIPNQTTIIHTEDILGFAEEEVKIIGETDDV